MCGSISGCLDPMCYREAVIWRKCKYPTKTHNAPARKGVVQTEEQRHVLVLRVHSSFQCSVAIHNWLEGRSPTGTTGVGASMISMLGRCSCKCLSCISYCFLIPLIYLLSLIPVNIDSDRACCSLSASGLIDCSWTKVRLIVRRLSAPLPSGLATRAYPR